MWRVALFCFLGLLLSCSDNPASVPDIPAERPGEPELPVEESHAVSFAVVPPEIIVDASAGSYTLTLLRENAASAPRRTLTVRAVTDAGRVVVPGSVTFDEASGLVTFELSYDFSAAGEAANVTVSAEEAVTVLRFVRPETPAVRMKGAYVHNFVRAAVDIEILESGSARVYNLKGEGLERSVRVEGEVAEALAVGGVTGFAAAVSTGGHDLPADPILSTKGRVSDDGSMISFGVVYPDGSACIDYIVIDDGEWEDCPGAVFTDAWVLPVVTFKAVKYVPACDYPWEVWLQRSRTRQGIYRIIDLYRGGCPLSSANTATAGDVLTIDARDPEAVVFGPSTSAFASNGLEAFEIGGTGVLSDDVIRVPEINGMASLSLGR